MVKRLVKGKLSDGRPRELRAWTVETIWGWVVKGWTSYGGSDERLKELAGPFGTRAESEAWIDGFFRGRERP